jgi:hypothetical protein
MMMWQGFLVHLKEFGPLYVCSRLEIDSTFNLCGKGWCVGDYWEYFSFDGQCDGHI